jgi:membrane-bound metal-dependent hydrolase YbcI (DUF457 family)
MPLTPFHLGPAIVLGLIFLRYVDLPTFLIANVIVDIEPMFIILVNLDLTHHQFLHTFLGGTFVAIILTWIMKKIRNKLSPLLIVVKIEQKVSMRNILLASLSGIYIHIILDSLMHADIRPFYPLMDNPFLNESILSVLSVYMVCIWSVIGGLIVYALRLGLIQKRRNKSNR